MTQGIGWLHRDLEWSLNLRRVIINRNFLIGISGFGILLFGFALLVSFAFLKPLEKSALEFLKQETTNQIHSRVDSLLGIDTVDKSYIQKMFLAKYETEVPLLKEDLKYLTDSISTVLSGNPDITEQEIAFAKIIAGSKITSKLWNYEVIKLALESLASIIKNRYEETWSALVTDIRIFSAVNLVSFCLVLILAFLVIRVPGYLSFCAWILIFSTVVSIIIYIYGQNWFYTILFNRYYGTGYLTMLSCIFSYLFFRGSLEYAKIFHNRET